MKPTAMLRAALISKCAQEIAPVTPAPAAAAPVAPGIMDRIGSGAAVVKDRVGAGLTTAKDWIGKNPGTAAGIAGGAGAGAAALLAAMLSRSSAKKRRVAA